MQWKSELHTEIPLQYATESEPDPDAGFVGAGILIVALIEACHTGVTQGLLGIKWKPPVILNFRPSLPMIWLIEQCLSAWP